MSTIFRNRRRTGAATLFLLITLTLPATLRAHCDTLDGPVAQDTEKAFAAGDVTPVLKWVAERDEKAIRAAFVKARAADGQPQAQRERARHHFLEELIKIHRRGEGAPFTGLKPAGSVEPAVAAADRALENGSLGDLEHHLHAAVSAGLNERFARVAEARRHKDESVAAGRAYVAAYVAYTHYVEALHQAASGGKGHDHAAGDADKHHAAEKKQGHRH